LEAAARACGSVLRAARGSVPTAETGGIEYRLRRSLADRLVLAVKPLLAGVVVERRGRLIGDVDSINQRPRGAGRKRGRMTGPKDKSFAIPKLLVGEAWRQVKANKGAPGVDGQDLDAFEKDLENNLYKVWNRMSSGTWFAAPVRAVEIPKPHGGGTRMLGVPTVTTYHKVVQAAFGFAGRHSSVSSAARGAPCGAVRPPSRRQSHLRVRGRAARQRGAA
jgi:hypothetical protein